MRLGEPVHLRLTQGQALVGKHDHKTTGTHRRGLDRPRAPLRLWRLDRRYGRGSPARGNVPSPHGQECGGSCLLSNRHSRPPPRAPAAMGRLRHEVLVVHLAQESQVMLGQGDDGVIGPAPHGAGPGCRPRRAGPHQCPSTLSAPAATARGRASPGARCSATTPSSPSPSCCDVDRAYSRSPRRKEWPPSRPRSPMP